MERVTLKFSAIKLLIALGVLLVSSISASYAATVAIPSSVITATPISFEGEASNLLVHPNNIPVSFTSDTQATFGNFQMLDNYTDSDLAALMGVSVETLSRADFFAFDSNNGSVGFEDSVWFFSDGINSISHTHDWLDGPNSIMIANAGTMDSGNDYNTLFGTSYTSGTDFGVILFDLASVGIDVASPDFNVSLQGGGLSCGVECPDVTLVGTVVPIPPAIALFSSSILVMFGSRFRKAKQCRNQRIYCVCSEQ